MRTSLTSLRPAGFDGALERGVCRTKHGDFVGAGKEASKERLMPAWPAMTPREAPRAFLVAWQRLVRSW
jgi:hypothetical protein